MSHQTGIKVPSHISVPKDLISASEELLGVFADAKNQQGNIRIIKVNIDTQSDPEQLVDGGSESVSGTWEDDFGNICKFVNEKECCYVLYKFDRNEDDQDTKWLFVHFVPDNSPPRSKMLYASTKATMLSQFGGKNYIADEMYATLKSELTLDGYRDHVEFKEAPVPLSMQELEIQRNKETEIRADVNVDSKHQTMQGLAFPLSQAALDALMSLKDKQVTYVQLSLDIDQETIELSASENCDVQGLSSYIPEGCSRYNFFCFKHQHEGDYKEDVVFIYSMGGYSSSIKERMLYSSCKANCLGVVEDQLEIEIVKKVEIDSSEKVTEDYLMDQVHPIRIVHKTKFDKPKGPGGRAGPRRMVKDK